MKQQEVFKKIGTILKELNDQYNYLENTENQLNDLELELFVANTHFLAEHAAVLRKLNLQNAPASVIPIAIGTEVPVKKTEEKYFEPVVQAPTPAAEAKPETEAPAKPAKAAHSITEPPPQIDLAANGADDDFSYLRHEPEIIKHELILDESQNWDEEDDPGFEIDEVAEIEEKTPEVAPVKAVKPEPVKEIPAVGVKKEIHPVASKKETPAEEPLTINQMMSAKLHKASDKAAEHPHVQPVADLKQVITLNDKLLYIKDLFNGYNLAYSEAIDILNRFSKFEEADNFLKTNYAVKNHWDSKQATVDKFYALLERRYAR
ncbi:MAG TPA: hypothetical protein VFE54_02770 [Mucilaginibacter sp.]|jgi:hypothetical protein|nr:hypothetical protein [Mucilaginibacter sp.]